MLYIPVDLSTVLSWRENKLLVSVIVLIQKYRENGIACARDLLRKGAQWGRKKRKDDMKDFPMVTKFQESFSQTDWGVLKSKSPTGGILPYRERGHISTPLYLIILWEQPTRSMVSGKHDGWSRGAFPEAVSQWPAPNRRSDPCVFMATIMSVLLQHFILSQIKRLTKSLTLIYLKHRW